MATMDRLLSEVKDADLVVFPELTLTGQIGHRSREDGARRAEASETMGGDLMKEVGALAKKHDKWIIAGMAEAHQDIVGVVFNTMAVVRSDGGIEGTQRKVHIPGEEKHHFAQGQNAECIDTPFGRIGIAICYDAYFPEYVRGLALQGAELLVFPFNGPIEASSPDSLSALAATRSLENRCYAVAVNRVGESIYGAHYFGGSTVAGPTGAVIAKAQSDATEVLTVTLDRRHLLEERAWQPSLSDRQPHLYGHLVTPL